MDYVEDIFITSRGTRIKVCIPIRTPEQEKRREQEIENMMISIYRQLEREGNLHILKKEKAKEVG